MSVRQAHPRMFIIVKITHAAICMHLCARAAETWTPLGSLIAAGQAESLGLSHPWPWRSPVDKSGRVRAIVPRGERNWALLNSLIYSDSRPNRPEHLIRDSQLHSLRVRALNKTELKGTTQNRGQQERQR